MSAPVAATTTNIQDYMLPAALKIKRSELAMLCSEYKYIIEMTVNTNRFPGLIKVDATVFVDICSSQAAVPSSWTNTDNNEQISLSCRSSTINFDENYYKTSPL